MNAAAARAPPGAPPPAPGPGGAWGGGEEVGRGGGQKGKPPGAPRGPGWVVRRPAVDGDRGDVHEPRPRGPGSQRGAARAVDVDRLVFLPAGALLQQRGRVHQAADALDRSEEHTSELQSQSNLVCRLLLEKKKKLHAKEPSGPVDPRNSSGAGISQSTYRRN